VLSDKARFFADFTLSGRAIFIASLGMTSNASPQSEENSNGGFTGAKAKVMLKNEVRSHQVIENKGSQSGTNPNTKPI
jgi:hypothetical protein